MSDRCDQKVFDKGKGVCALTACMHRAELWVQSVAKESGQKVDWHYSGGIANVLYLGKYKKVAETVVKLAGDLSKPMARKEGECGTCTGDTHRPGRILQMFGADAHGLYRAGDELPDGVIGVSNT